MLKRTDSAKWIVDLACVPRPQGYADSQEVLQMLGQVLQAATAANDMLAPIGASFDGGTPNSKANRAFCGLLTLEELMGIPFFQDCAVVSMPEAPCWPFAQLQYRGGRQPQPMYGCNDGWHNQKKYSLQHSSGCRFCVHGILWVSLTCEAWLEQAVSI